MLYRYIIVDYKSVIYDYLVTLERIDLLPQINADVECIIRGKE